MKTKVYFENLNGIRFIAALLVIIHHIEQFKSIFHLPNHWNNATIKILGELGVVLFFVLSGFLITYLMYTEKNLTGDLHLKKFYYRRILRIWPLYFFIVLAAMFVFPYIDFLSVPDHGRTIVQNNLFHKLAMFVLFAPNVLLAIYGVITFASQTWSIGVEEQFYLIWPVLNKYIKNKLAVILLLILLYLMLRWILAYLPYSTLLLLIYNFTPIDCMGIGALFAYLIFESNAYTKAIVSFIFRKEIQFIVVASLILLILNGVHFKAYNKEIYAILFGILIANLAVNKKRLFSLENSLMNYLGKISYGLYMYHPLAIVICIKIFALTYLESFLLLYIVVIALTILFSTLSYRFMEKPFIELKMKYSEIISGDNAKQK